MVLRLCIIHRCCYTQLIVGFQTPSDSIFCACNRRISAIYRYTDNAIISSISSFTVWIFYSLSYFEKVSAFPATIPNLQPKQTTRTAIKPVIIPNNPEWHPGRYTGRRCVQSSTQFLDSKNCRKSSTKSYLKNWTRFLTVCERIAYRMRLLQTRLWKEEEQAAMPANCMLPHRLRPHKSLPPDQRAVFHRRSR